MEINGLNHLLSFSGYGFTNDLFKSVYPEIGHTTYVGFGNSKSKISFFKICVLTMPAVGNFCSMKPRFQMESHSFPISPEMGLKSDL